MKNKTLPALILSIAVMAGVMTSITDAYAQTTNTDRLMTVVETTGDTNSMVAMLNAMLEEIKGTLNNIVSALTGLSEGQEAIMDKQDAISASIAPLTSMQQDLGADAAEIQSKIGDVSDMLSGLESRLMAEIHALETSIADMQTADTGDDELEAAVNNLNMLIRNSQAATDERLAALEQAVSERLTSIETQLGGVTEDITEVSEKVDTQAQAEFTGGYQKTVTRDITLFDYLSNFDDYNYNEDVAIDHNLRFSCEETVYVSSVKVDTIGDMVEVSGVRSQMIELVHADVDDEDDPMQYALAPVNKFHPFNTTGLTKSDVTVSGVGIVSVKPILNGDKNTQHNPYTFSPKQLELQPDSSFTIETAMANKVGGTDSAEYVFYQSPDATAYPSGLDLATLLDTRARVNSSDIGEAAATAVATDLEALSNMFVVLGADVADSAADTLELRLENKKKMDKKPLRTLADVDLLKVTVEVSSAVSDPKCTFTPIGEAEADYPNMNQKVNVFTTIENIEVNATVTCNGQDTRIESVDDIRVGGDISTDNTSVGTLTLSAGGESIKIDLDTDAQTFNLPADSDVDFPLEFTDTLEITGVIVPGSTPASIIIELTYDTAAGNTCTQQQ